MSLRALRWHERRLLKRADFLQWKSDAAEREVRVLRRYRIQRREDYTKYNRLVGVIHKLSSRLQALSADDPERISGTEQLLSRLYALGLISTSSSLAACERLTASSFCRRRLPVVLFRLRFASSISEAVRLVEQGHVRVGPEVVTDAALLVTRSMEDFVTWAEGSSIKAKVDAYHESSL
jgi:U3 small nucleolar ribonucleoprotein protein IMP3